MQQLANSGAPRQRNTYSRETPEQFNVTQESITKSRCRCGVVDPNVVEDDLQFN